MKRAIGTRIFPVVFALSLVAVVEGSAIAQPAIPVRELSPPTAKSAETFGAILGVREIAAGKLLVNDARRRQLSVLDPKLANKTVMIDSAAVGGQGRTNVVSTSK